VTAPPSEATRTRVRAQVRASRQRQGLPEHITDPAVLDRLAGRVLEQMTELTWIGTDDAVPAGRGAQT
jgi:hypothetical protein